MTDNPIGIPRPKSLERGLGDERAERRPKELGATVTFYSGSESAAGSQNRVEISFSNLLENIATEICIYAGKVLLTPFSFLRAALKFRHPDFYEQDHFLPKPFALMAIMSILFAGAFVSSVAGPCEADIKVRAENSDAEMPSESEMAEAVRLCAIEQLEENQTNAGEGIEANIWGGVVLVYTGFFSNFDFNEFLGEPKLETIMLPALPGLLLFSAIALLLSGLGRALTVQIPWRRMFALLSWSTAAFLLFAFYALLTFSGAVAFDSGVVYVVLAVLYIVGLPLFGLGHLVAMLMYANALPRERKMSNLLYVAPLGAIFGLLYGALYAAIWILTGVPSLPTLG